MSPVDPAGVVGAVASAPALLAQVGADGASSDPSFGPVVGFVVSLATYLVAGGILLAVVPDASRRAVEHSRRRPLYTFLVGLGGAIAGAVVAFVLALTIVGLLVVIPGLVVWVLLGVAGAAYGAILVGSLVTGPLNVEGRGVDLVFGAVVVSLVGLVPVLGGLVDFVVGTIGFGAVLLVVFGSSVPGYEEPSGDRGSDPGRPDGYGTGYVRRGSGGRTDRRDRWRR